MVPGPAAVELPVPPESVVEAGPVLVVVGVIVEVWEEEDADEDEEDEVDVAVPGRHWE